MKEGRELDIPADGGNNEGDGNGGDIDLKSPEAEWVAQFIATRPILDL